MSPRFQNDPALVERRYGDRTEEEIERIEQNKCVLPCNTAVCPVYGSAEMILSDGKILRPDGRRAFCNGCSTDRQVPCSRSTCQHFCEMCHTPYNVKDPKRILSDSVPAACGQKHRFPLVELENVGGLEQDDVMAPWVPPAKWPKDRFLVGIQPNKAYVKAAEEQVGHTSWMASAKGLWPKPPRDLRDYFGIPDDHFFCLNFRVKDKWLEEMWAEREPFFDWLAKQRIDICMTVNFSPWGDLPRFNAFLMQKRMMLSYKMMMDRGIPVGMEFEMAQPWYLDRYLEQFRAANGIQAVHSSWQMGTGGGPSGAFLGRVKRTSDLWEPNTMHIFATGASSPRAAVYQLATFRNQKVYLGNMDIYVRAGHWKLPGGVKVSKRKKDRTGIFVTGVEMWQRWTERLYAAASRLDIEKEAA